jgi:hypothetical protein
VGTSDWLGGLFSFVYSLGSFFTQFSAGPVVWGFDPAAQDGSLSKAKAYFAKDTIIEHLLFSTFFSLPGTRRGSKSSSEYLQILGQKIFV